MNPEAIEVAKQAFENATSLKGVAIGAGTIGPPAIMAANQLCTVNYMAPNIIFPLITSVLTSIFVIIQIREIYLKRNS